MVHGQRWCSTLVPIAGVRAMNAGQCGDGDGRRQRTVPVHTSVGCVRCTWFFAAGGSRVSFAMRPSYVLGTCALRQRTEAANTEPRTRS